MTTTIRPTTPTFFHADDGRGLSGAFLSCEVEHDTGDIIIHAPIPMRITPDVRDAYIAWLSNQRGPKS